MKFGPLPLDDAVGAVLAHAIKQGDVVFKKGTMLGAAEIERLRAAGITSVVAARLEDGDIGEDAAAQILAEHISGTNIRIDRPFTGRCNLFAETAGVFRVDAYGIDALNSIDESITVATLAANKAVVPGEMVATVKIIPFSVPEAMLEQARTAKSLRSLHVAAYRPKSVAMISTTLPGLKPSVIEKTIRVMGDRIEPAGGRIVSDARVEHEPVALATALKKAAGETGDLIVVFGASAITDRQDVIPAALEMAGGRVEHFGMPVDPGNLLLIGSLHGRPVIGAPGCARSPKENGFDWVLQRMMAGIEVTRADIQNMGVGGLLMEIVSRPQPRGDIMQRNDTVTQPRLAIVLLAAGRSTRMGRVNKLLAEHHGVPLVRHAANAAVASGVGEVIAVIGHQGTSVAGALSGLPVQIVDNPAYADGLSSSLKAGLAAVGNVDGVIVALGDMPLVDHKVIKRLADVFAENPKAKAVVPTTFGQRGNPVLIGRALFPAISALAGDVGARQLLDSAGDDIFEVMVDDPGIHRDVDTPEALQALPN